MRPFKHGATGSRSLDQCIGDLPSDEFGFAAHRSSRLVHSQRTIKKSYERTQSRTVYHCRRAGSAERQNRQTIVTTNPHLEHSLQEKQIRAMRSKVLAVAFLLIAFAAAAHAQSAPVVASGDQRFHFTEKPGPDAVGLKVVEQYDFSRSYRSITDELGKPYQGERARPLQTLIWYPAQKSSGKPMTVGDYGDLLATETSFGRPELSPDWKQWLDSMKPTLKDSMWAVRNAPLLAGRFPVVIYAPSLSSMSWENADLCEYLASHGYVVVASPDMGATVTGYDQRPRRYRCAGAGHLVSDWVRADAAEYRDVGDCGGGV